MLQIVMVYLTDSQASIYPLIGSMDPQPFSLINESGSAKVLLVGDHVSRVIPKAMYNLGLEEEMLDQHVAYDIGTYNLIHYLSEHLDAPAVLASYSRLVVDLNRSLEDPSVFIKESDGISIPGNQGLTREEKAQRIKSFYTPYRKAIDIQLHRLRMGEDVPALIALHSFTPELKGVKRPWHIGLLWDVDPRIPLPLLKELRAHPDNLHVGDNQPYSGRHPADYTIDHHAEAAGLPHVSIEVRQDLIDTDEGAEHWASILADALKGILADPQLYRLWVR